MEHLGDITKISGRIAPVVDCVIGGSPCQDLSIAGRRAGLTGERSGLFMEQIRIVKEMREEDMKRGRTGNAIRPRFMVWENVPGAFSSNGGADFKAVLEEIIRIAEPEAPDIPLPPKGKWPLADAYYGDGWSVAYRVLDAQFWGVPQRRRRITVVADFGGHAAPEILFVRQSVSGDIAAGGAAGKETSVDIGTGPETASGTEYLTGWDCQEKRIFTDRGVAPTLSGSDGGGGRTGCGYVFCCMATGQAGAEITEGISPTLTCNHEQPIICLMDQGGSVMDTLLDKTGTLRAQEHGNQPIVLNLTLPEDVANTLRAQGNLSFRGDQDNIVLCLFENHGQDSRITGPLDIAPTVAQKFGTGGNNTPLVLAAAFSGRMGAKAGNIGYEEEQAATLSAERHDTTVLLASIVPTAYAVDVRGGSIDPEINGTLQAGGHGFSPNLNSVLLEVASVDCRNGTIDFDVNGTLQAKSNGGISLNLNNVVLILQQDEAISFDLAQVKNKTNQSKGSKEVAYSLSATGQPVIVLNLLVRRLTPMECERLQGYPDGWTDIGEWRDSNGKLHKESSDTSRYMALGNSIALPPWRWVLKRLCSHYEREATMASLFDGIGGFPLIWEQLNGKGTCLWASEIEEFPMAVTKYHFQ